MSPRLDVREIRHFHLFCGLGGGARGFNAGEARAGNMVGAFRCIGGVDVDAASIRDFQRLAGVPGTRLDLFSRDQYEAFHGRSPPDDWREATPQDIQRAAGFERPHIVFLSAPCKGFSGLLAEKASATAKYQALNALTLRGVWLMLEAFADDPPELIIFENVPRIATRGRRLLDHILVLLRAAGYVANETTHDCGEIGELGQSRKRFLLVARHAEKVPPFLYEPPRRRLRGVGEILEGLPLPGDLARGGPMHRIPSLQWKTWVRLAFVEAGSDWRSLNKLAVENGFLRDYRIEGPGPRAGFLGVRTWDDTTGAVCARAGPTNGAFSVADPRLDGETPRFSNAYRIGEWSSPSVATTSARGSLAAVADPRVERHPNRNPDGNHGVRTWDQPTGTITSKMMNGAGAHAVADPRLPEGARYASCYRIVPWSDHAKAVTGSDGSFQGYVADPRATWGPDSHRNKLRVTPWDGAAGSVTGTNRVGSGAACVADPRPSQRTDYKQNKYRVTGLDEPSGAVIAASTTGNGAFAVADPRPVFAGERREAYQTGGHYGVTAWGDHAGAIPAHPKNNNGPWSVADPRLPEPRDSLVCVIQALDGTWHRPFTTLELAALQSLFDPEDGLELDGASDSGWRERIGNAVPSAAAKAVASVMGRTLLLAWSGETFMLSSEPIWVRPIAIALAVDSGTPRA